MRDFTKGLFKFLAAILVIALIAGTVLYVFFVRVVEVGHNGMAPTIIAGDTILVWRGTDFELGDPVLCPHPSEPGRYVLGRVVGTNGHTVEIGRGAQLMINGETPDVDLRGEFEFYDAGRQNSARMHWGIEDILDHDHLFMYSARRAPSMRPHQVRGGLFLLSDNRSYHGEDSRSFGEVAPGTCIGTVFMRVMPGEGPTQSPTDHGPFAFIE